VKPWMQDEDPPPQAPWLNTYADMVTLLLCFFVLLFSMSVVNVKKFEAVMSSLQGALGILEGAPVPTPNGSPTEVFDAGDLVAQLLAKEMAEMAELQEVIEKELKESGLSDKVGVSLEERGVVLRFADTVLFDVGQDTLRPESAEALQKIGEIIKDLDNPIRVEGHTDNWPISTPRFPSNWELSTARATRVVRFLIEEAGVEPRQLQAAGYGEYYPIESNETAEGRQKNRRVDIVILRPSLSSAEPNR